MCIRDREKIGQEEFEALFVKPEESFAETETEMQADPRG